MDMEFGLRGRLETIKEMPTPVRMMQGQRLMHVGAKWRQGGGWGGAVKVLLQGPLECRNTLEKRFQTAGGNKETEEVKARASCGRGGPHHSPLNLDSPRTSQLLRVGAHQPQPCIDASCAVFSQ